MSWVQLLPGTIRTAVVVVEVVILMTAEFYQ